MATNKLKMDRIAYCAGMDPEDYKATCTLSADASKIDYNNYDKTYEAVEAGECDVCVLPFERSRSIVKVFKWDSGTEITRYAVLSKEENESSCEDGSRFMIIFTVKNMQGTLVKAINAISSHGFNIRFLHTRPLQYEEWGYYFYIECDGDDQSEEGKKMLEDLSGVCETLRFIGRYPSK